MGDSKIADILDEAADFILVHGHCKGDLRGPDGSACAVGSLTMCASGQLLDDAIDVLDAEVASLGYPFDPDALLPPVARYNDAPTTTADDVIDLMRRAAKELRNE